MNRDKLNSVQSADVLQAAVKIMDAVQNFDPAVQVVAVAAFGLLIEASLPAHEDGAAHRVASRILAHKHRREDPERRALVAYIQEEIAKRLNP